MDVHDYAIDWVGYDSCHVTDLIKSCDESGRCLVHLDPELGSVVITDRHCVNEVRRWLTK